MSAHKFTSGCQSCAAIAAALSRELGAGTIVETNKQTTTADRVVLVEINAAHAGEPVAARCHGWETRAEFEGGGPHDWRPMATLAPGGVVFAWLVQMVEPGLAGDDDDQ